jgi:hypothetical protein
MIEWRYDFENMPKEQEESFLAWVRLDNGEDARLLYWRTRTLFLFDDEDPPPMMTVVTRDAGVCEVGFWYDDASYAGDCEYGSEGDSLTKPSDILAWCPITAPTPKEGSEKAGEEL